MERQDAQVSGIMSNLDFASLEIAEQTQRAVAEMGHTRLTEVHPWQTRHGGAAKKMLAGGHCFQQSSGLAWPLQ